MATPAIRRLRQGLVASGGGESVVVDGLMRPGIDRVLAPGGVSPVARLFDGVHVGRPRGLGGRLRLAGVLRREAYDAALLLTNSFSTALVVRFSGIPRRVGFARDGRGVLLTECLRAPRRDGGWATVPAVDYYWHAAGALLGEAGPEGNGLRAGDRSGGHRLPIGAALELPIGDEDITDARRVAGKLGLEGAFAVLNPGGNNVAKRWPAERFGEVARRLSGRGLAVLVNGSPGEAGVVDEVVAASAGAGRSLVEAGGTLGSLKVLVSRASLLVTNDTGPRHFAAATRTPVVSLFGPTDHRWTCIPTPGGEEVVLADPTLPPELSANDHPDRCRVDRIPTERVWQAAESLLEAPPIEAGRPTGWNSGGRDLP